MFLHLPSTPDFSFSPPSFSYSVNEVFMWPTCCPRLSFNPTKERLCALVGPCGRPASFTVHTPASATVCLGGGGAGGGVGGLVQHGWGLRAALELRQCSVKHRMLHEVSGCCRIWLNSPACLAWRVLVEVTWRCRMSAPSTQRTHSVHRLVCRPQTTGCILGGVVFIQQSNRFADLL